MAVTIAFEVSTQTDKYILLLLLIFYYLQLHDNRSELSIFQFQNIISDPVSPSPSHFSIGR